MKRGEGSEWGGYTVWRGVRGVSGGWVYSMERGEAVSRRCDRPITPSINQKAH